MKQTVILLSSLLVVLMVLTGLILTGSMQQTELIAQRDEMLSDLRKQRETLTLENTRYARKVDSLIASVEQLTLERDALTSQLNDAVLSSQEANDAVALQTARQQELEEALAAASMELETLRQALSPTPAP